LVSFFGGQVSEGLGDFSDFVSGFEVSFLRVLLRGFGTFFGQMPWFTAIVADSWFRTFSREMPGLSAFVTGRLF
jgi:hypothetical protein